MPETAKIQARFALPTRVRLRKRLEAELKARLDLIDRIADLQGVDVAEQHDDSGSCRVDAHLRLSRPVAPYPDSRSTLLCSLSSDGISIFDLDRWAQNQVVAHGWGALHETYALVHLPRDANELEAVWQIVRRAYDHWQIEPNTEHAGPVLSTWDWPQISRTSLQ